MKSKKLCWETKNKETDRWKRILREHEQMRIKYNRKYCGKREEKRIETPSQCDDLQKWICSCKIMISDNDVQTIQCNKL
jgi:hypothetical protein